MGLVGRAAALALLVLCLAVPSAFGQAAPPAQTFTVTTTADDTPGACDPSHCTLREAVIAANTFTNADTISVPTGTYLLTIGVNGGEPNTAHEDLDISQPVTIRGVGARTTIVDQQQSDRVFEVLPGAGNVRIEGLAITGGQTDGDAGGFRSDGANTTLADVAVRGNTANGQGGGIQNMNGTLTIERSLIVGNSSGSSFSGGGIHNGASGILNVSNSTISGNAGEDSAALADEGTTTISYSTIVNNTSLGGGAVVDERGPPTITVRDSIIANNSPQNCIAPLISQGRNIDSANTCGFDRPNTNPLLGALADNGGQTDTHHPLAGSPAIDAASSSGCPTTDQRGFPRPSGATCDIGAVELQVAPPPPPPPPTPAALFLEPATADRTPGETHTVTATAQNNDGSPAAGRSLRYEIDGVNESAGALTTDASGRAQISWKGVHEGTDVVKAYVDTNTNQTTEPSEPTGQASVDWVLPAPVQGRTANIEPVSGRVRITVRPRRS